MIVFMTGIKCSSRLEKIKAINLSWVAPILDKQLDTIFIQKEWVFMQPDDKQQKIYTYWMYKKNHKKGIRYKGARQDTIGITFDVDSFLVKDAFKNFPFYSKEADSLVSKIANRNNREVIERYVPKSRPDDSYPDSMIVRYNSDYQDIPFYFSSELEDGKKSRITEILGIYNPIPNSTYKAQLRGRKMSFQIERIPVENSEEKMCYFERFKKSFEKLK